MLSITKEGPLSLINHCSRLARWISTFIAAWLSLQLLHTGDNGPKSSTSDEKDDASSNTSARKGPLLAGRTLDLTLFSVTRALDVIVGEWWSRRSQRRRTSGKWTNVRLSSEPLFLTTPSSNSGNRSRDSSHPSPTQPSLQPRQP
jgi:uncharacterized membrane protein YgcG